MSKSNEVLEKVELSEEASDYMCKPWVSVSGTFPVTPQDLHVDKQELVVVCRRPKPDFLREALPGPILGPPPPPPPDEEPLEDVVVWQTDASEDKNHVSLLPVSRMTCWVCAGVPTLTEAKYPPYEMLLPRVSVYVAARRRMLLGGTALFVRVIPMWTTPGVFEEEAAAVTVAGTAQSPARAAIWSRFIVVERVIDTMSSCIYDVRPARMLSPSAVSP